MTFNELVKIIGQDNGLTRNQSRKVVKDVFAMITGVLSVGDNVLVPDFGRFETTNRKARHGTNLVTGERVMIPPKIAVKFTPTKHLKKIVDRN